MNIYLKAKRNYINISKNKFFLSLVVTMLWLTKLCIYLAIDTPFWPRCTQCYQQKYYKTLGNWLHRCLRHFCWFCIDILFSFYLVCSESENWRKRNYYEYREFLKFRRQKKTSNDDDVIDYYKRQSRKVINR